MKVREESTLIAISGPAFVARLADSSVAIINANSIICDRLVTIAGGFGTYHEARVDHASALDKQG